MEHQQHGAMPGTDTSTTAPTLYDHPDGFVIGYADRHLIVIDDNGLEIHLPIAPYGMKLLAYRLLALATDLEGAHP